MTKAERKALVTIKRSVWRLVKKLHAADPLSDVTHHAAYIHAELSCFERGEL